MNAEVQRVAAHLARFPAAHTTMERKDLKELLLSCDGMVFVQGQLRRIVSNRIGAGVYAVRTVADGEPTSKGTT